MREHLTMIVDRKEIWTLDIHHTPKIAYSNPITHSHTPNLEMPLPLNSKIKETDKVEE